MIFINYKYRMHTSIIVDYTYSVLDCHADPDGSRPGRGHLFVKKYLALYLVVALMVISAPSVVSVNSNCSWWSALAASSFYTSV